MNDEIIRIRQEIGFASGHAPGSLPRNYPTTNIKTDLRKLARAYGITGTCVSDGTITTDDLRAIYNEGQTAVDAIKLRITGQPPLPEPRRFETETEDEAYQAEIRAYMEKQQRAETTTFADKAKAAFTFEMPPQQPAHSAPSGAQADALNALGQALASLSQSKVDPAQVREIARSEIQTAGAHIAEQAAMHFADTLPELVRDELAKVTRKVEISIPAMPKVEIGTAHQALPTILQAVVAGASPFLVGPAGSGKTTLAEQIATALGRPFYMAARVNSEHKLVGYQDAQGRYVSTAFRRAFEEGGVFLFDEVDASDPDAMTAFNAALANGLGDFPDGQIRKHPEFVALAAGNTYGRGADRQYVGRNQLDAATLDRFQVFEVDYDETLERALAGNDEWARYVQKVRAAVEREKVRCIVSPRASIMGARLLASGMDRLTVENATIWKGMADAERARVSSAMAKGR